LTIVNDQEIPPAERRAPAIPPNLMFFLLLLALLCVHFAFLRGGLIVRNRANIGDATRGQILGSFLTGLRFDLAMACYLVAPFAILAHLPRISFDRSPRHRRVFLFVFLALMSVLTFLCLAEYEFFNEFQTRFNQLALQYLDQGSTVTGMVWHQYPVVRYVLMWLVIATIFGAAVWALMRWCYRNLPENRGKLTGRQTVIEIAAVVALAAVLVIGMRGGLQSEPLRWGNAFTSSNEFTNQMGLNGLYTLGVKDRASHKDASAAWVNRMPLEEARRVARALVVEPDEILTDPADRTVLRRDPTEVNWLALRHRERAPNVVLVVMESFSARFVGAVGSPQDFTPHFDALAKDGVLFSRAFSSGTHTHQGVFSSLLGFPNLPGYEYLMENYVSNQPFSSLPGVLKERGYHTMFLYNGNLAWDNMRGFFRKQAIDRFVGGDDFDDTVQKDRVWGVNDKDLFDRANREFAQADANGPFFGIILTLSNHAPFDLPKPLPFGEATTTMGELNKRIDGVRYADWAVGQFIEAAKKLPYFENTLFVFTGDHGFHVAPKLTEANLLYHHVPILFYAPGLTDQRGFVSRTVINQVNIAPSIIGLLGIDAPAAYWARNVFSKDFDPDDNFAMFKGSGGANDVAIVRDDKLLVVGETGAAKLWRYDLSFPPSVKPLTGPENDALKQRMEHELAGYVQAALNDLTTYRAGPVPKGDRSDVAEAAAH
jgi:phosphoglycerol transferase MdoB-like AlkP superfamily enzyme